MVVDKTTMIYVGEAQSILIRKTHS
jgi:hypothetical protein